MISRLSKRSSQGEFNILLGFDVEANSAQRCTRVVTSNPSGSIVAVINYGPKDDPSWFENQTKATEYLDKMRPECSFDPHARRGGSLSALNYGLQHGNGGTVSNPMLSTGHFHSHVLFFCSDQVWLQTKPPAISMFSRIFASSRSSSVLLE